MPIYQLPTMKTALPRREYSFSFLAFRHQFALTQEMEVVLGDADILSCPFASTMFYGKQFALLVMNWFLASTLPRRFLFMIASIFKFLLNTLLSSSVFSFFVFFLVDAVFALQKVAAFVMIPQALCIEMLPTELAIASVASVRSYILRMVALLPASFAH